MIDTVKVIPGLLLLIGAILFLGPACQNAGDGDALPDTIYVTDDDDDSADDDDDITGADDDDDNNDDSTDELRPPLVKQSVFRSPSNMLIYFVSLQTSEAVTAAINYGNVVYDNSTPPVEIAAGEIVNIPLLGLAAGAGYKLIPELTDQKGKKIFGRIDSLEVEPWPSDWPLPVVTRMSNEPIDDKELVCAQSFGASPGDHNMIVCYDRRGVPRWYYLYPDKCPALGFQALQNGRFAVNCDNRIEIIEKTGESVASYWMSHFYGKTRFNHTVGHHEIIEITEGPWAGTLAFLTQGAPEPVTFPAGMTIPVGEEQLYLNFPFFEKTDPTEIKLKATAGMIVFNPESGEVLWDWDLAGNLRDGKTIDPQMLPYTRWGLNTNVPNHSLDLGHANSLVHGIDYGGQYFLMSLRHQDWIIKINVETDKIEWRLGWGGDFKLLDTVEPWGVELAPEKWFFHQHRPIMTLNDGRRHQLVIYDNGTVRPIPGYNDREEEYSRAVSIYYDENLLRAALTFEYGPSNPADPQHFYSAALGEVEPLPDGNSMIISNGGDSRQNGLMYLLEISYPLGIPLWLADFKAAGAVPVREFIYRTDFFRSIYDTTNSQ